MGYETLGGVGAGKGAPALDLDFLAQYTGGDREIRDQVLEMFITQAHLLIARLGEAKGEAGPWKDVTHSLKGCARGVGATAFADLAQQAEADAKASAEVHADYIERLSLKLRGAEAFVRSVLAGS